MKNFLKNLQQWATIWLWIVLIILLSWAVYAWSWITASDLDSLDYTKWNEMVTTLNNKITNTGNEAVGGIKTFSSFPVTPSSNPSTDYQVSNKKYVDDTVVSVPSWAIMPFNLASCPTGWSEADGTWWTPDLRWTFVRWKNGDANGRDVARGLASYQSDDFKSHNHRLNNAITQAMQTSASAWGLYAPMVGASTVDNWPTTISTGWTETRPKNVALLYCVKD